MNFFLDSVEIDYNKFKKLERKAFNYYEGVNPNYLEDNDLLNNSDYWDLCEKRLKRLDVLIKIYTSGKLKKKLQSHITMMFSFYTYVLIGGELKAILNGYSNGFPLITDIGKTSKKLENKIIKEIRKYKK